MRCYKRFRLMAVLLLALLAFGPVVTVAERQAEDVTLPDEASELFDWQMTEAIESAPGEVTIDLGPVELPVLENTIELGMDDVYEMPIDVPELVTPTPDDSLAPTYTPIITARAAWVLQP